ncbi:MAG: hypothetical protein CM15mP95_3330 [Alphaproteobacteria bacterium]|nr:MAG: hypothetical protein CM15mP95_3330 [Alphaproteobacteria bacterium]
MRVYGSLYNKGGSWPGFGWEAAKISEKVRRIQTPPSPAPRAAGAIPCHHRQVFCKTKTGKISPAPPRVFKGS